MHGREGSWLTTGVRIRYKVMASHSSSSLTAGHSSTRKSITPQSTGFSQIHARGGGEGGGQAMSVMLSWHEKVCMPRRVPASSPTELG